MKDAGLTYDDKTIWLEIFPESEKGQVDFTFEIRCVTDKALVLFKDIWYQVIQSVSQGHVVLYAAPYCLACPSSKRLFGGRLPAEYVQNDAASQLKKWLIETQWNSGLYGDLEYFQKEKGWLFTRHHDFKSLFILLEQVDIALLQKTDFSRQSDGGDCGVWMKVFPENTILHQNSTEKTLEYYRTTDDFLMEIYISVLWCQTDVTINTRYISTKHFVKEVKAIAKKHNSELQFLH